MTLSLGLGAPGAPKITICPPNVRITSVLTIIFDISVVYDPIELCFGYDTPVGLCYHISRAHGHIIGFRGPLEPLNDPVTSKGNSILDLAISIILDVYTVSSLYFEFDVAVGLFYQTPKAKAPKIEVNGP